MFYKSDDQVLGKLTNYCYLNEGNKYATSEDFEKAMSTPLSEADLVKSKDKLVRNRIHLKQKYQFFGYLLQTLSTCFTYSVDTMAVDDYGNIYINPNFCLNELTDDEVQAVLAHEIMHVCTLSFFRQRGRIHQLWNIVTDFIMNRDLTEMGMKLPEMACVPEEKHGSYVLPKVPVVPPAIVGLDITDLTAEQLYDKFKQAMPKDKDKAKQMADMMDKIREQFDKHLGKDGKMKPKPGKEGQPGDGTIVVVDVSGLPGPKDSGMKPKPRTGKNAKDVEREVRQAIQQAVDQMEREHGQPNPGGGGRGTAPGGVPRSFNKKSLAPKKDWMGILRQFLAPVRNVTYDNSRFKQRPMSAFIPMPRRRTLNKKIKLAVAIDTSGSIGDDVLGVFLGGIYGILKTFPVAELRVILWHTEVYNEIEIEKMDKKVIITVAQPTSVPGQNKKNSTDVVPDPNLEMNSNGEIITTMTKAEEVLKKVYAKFSDTGGTILSSIKDHLDKNKEHIDGLLVFTDGGTEHDPKMPTPPNRTIFMINEGGNGEHLKKFGTVDYVDVPHGV